MAALGKMPASSDRLGWSKWYANLEVDEVSTLSLWYLLLAAFHGELDEPTLDPA